MLAYPDSATNFIRIGCNKGNMEKFSFLTLSKVWFLIRPLTNPIIRNGMARTPFKLDTIRIGQKV